MSFISALTLRRLTTAHAIRIAPSSLRAFHLQYRRFSSTPQRKATEEESLYRAAKQNPIIQELQRKPEVMEAMRDLMTVMQEEGFEVSATKAPSMTQILMNSRVRKQCLSLAEVLRDSGIDMSRLQEAFGEIQQHLKKPEEK
ncbi:hypothetical protein C8Q75DRAFT_272244 [Abortiporus biennis]|nr:hypothetical protein C8Q75DRAFT_272244 [Abortiporus biennis]